MCIIYIYTESDILSFFIEYLWRHGLILAVFPFETSRDATVSATRFRRALASLPKLGRPEFVFLEWWWREIQPGNLTTLKMIYNWWFPPMIWKHHVWWFCKASINLRGILEQSQNFFRFLQPWSDWLPGSNNVPPVQSDFLGYPAFWCTLMQFEHITGYI